MTHFLTKNVLCNAAGESVPGTQGMAEDRWSKGFPQTSSNVGHRAPCARMLQGTSRIWSRCKTKNFEICVRRSLDVTGCHWHSPYSMRCLTAVQSADAQTFLEVDSQVQKLKAENDELRKLTTDEDKTLLLWKAALTFLCRISDISVFKGDLRVFCMLSLITDSEPQAW